MKQGLWFVGAFSLLSSGWLWFQGGGWLPTRLSHADERWVDANHVRIQVKGKWQEVMLMPLADHLCQSGQPLFERYCNDPSGKAPSR